MTTKNRYDLGTTNLYRTVCKWTAIKSSASIWMLTAACEKSLNVTQKPDNVVRLYVCNDLNWLRFFQRGKDIFSQSRSPCIFEVCTWLLGTFKFVRGMSIVPGLRHDILWRWASCTGLSSIREVSLLLSVQMVYRNMSRARRPNRWQRKSNSVLYRRPHFWGQNTLWHEICKPALEKFPAHEFLWNKEPFLRTLMWKPKAILLGVFWKLYVNPSFRPVRSGIKTTWSNRDKLRMLG
jgi:hypothetical protein